MLDCDNTAKVLTNSSILLRLTWSIVSYTSVVNFGPRFIFLLSLWFINHMVFPLCLVKLELFLYLNLQNYFLHSFPVVTPQSWAVSFLWCTDECTVTRPEDFLSIPKKPQKHSYFWCSPSSHLQKLCCSLGSSQDFRALPVFLLSVLGFGNYFLGSKIMIEFTCVSIISCSAQD